MFLECQTYFKLLKKCSLVKLFIGPILQIGFDSCPQTAGHNMRARFDINSWVESLTEELIQDLLMDALEIRMKNRDKGLLKEDNKQIDVSKVLNVQFFYITFPKQTA